MTRTEEVTRYPKVTRVTLARTECQRITRSDPVAGGKEVVFQLAYYCPMWLIIHRIHKQLSKGRSMKENNPKWPRLESLTGKTCMGEWVKNEHTMGNKNESQAYQHTRSLTLQCNQDQHKARYSARGHASAMLPWGQQQEEKGSVMEIS